MSAPNITVVIEPSDGDSIVYEPTAPKDTNDTPHGVICLMLNITNNEAKTIHLNQVTLSFGGPPAVPTATIPVPANWWPPNGSGVDIAPGGMAEWNFLREYKPVENDSVILPWPAPGTVTLNLFFDGFNSPWSVTRTLGRHQNPVTGNAYLYPAQYNDLRPGEFWVATSNTHGTGAAGSQLFAYDMGVKGWDPQTKSMTDKLPGTDGAKNEDYRVWGKQIHAMADGNVVQFLDGVGTNPKPGDSNGPWKQGIWDPSTQAGLDQAWKDHVGAGNHFYIQHGNEVALYAHMQEGTLNPNLLQVGAPVKAGDKLGLAGNAGSASGPHLHIHAIKGTQAEIGPLRPLLFRQIFTIDPSDLKMPNIAGPWARVEAQGPPLGPDDRYIWPLGRHPEWAGWQDLGGPITSAPAVSSWQWNRLDVFAAGANGPLSHKWWDGSVWHGWQNLGGVFKEGPAAVSWGPHRIDVFVRGMDDHLGHLWYDGSNWQGWQDLGGPLTSGPAVASWAAHRLDVFAAGADGQLKHKWWDGSIWHDWQNLGGSFKGVPAAVSWGPNRIDVFVRGMDDHLGHLWFNGNAWQGWQDLGGPIASAPAVCSWGPNRLDVFAAQPDGNLTHKWWDGSNWSDWDWVGGVFQANPAAVSWGPNRMDIFVRGMDNHLGHLWRG